MMPNRSFCLATATGSSGSTSPFLSHFRFFLGARLGGPEVVASLFGDTSFRLSTPDAGSGKLVKGVLIGERLRVREASCASSALLCVAADEGVGDVSLVPAKRNLIFGWLSGVGGVLRLVGRLLELGAERLALAGNSSSMLLMDPARLAFNLVPGMSVGSFEVL